VESVPQRATDLQETQLIYPNVSSDGDRAQYPEYVGKCLTAEPYTPQPGRYTVLPEHWDYFNSKAIGDSNFQPKTWSQMHKFQHRNTSNMKKQGNVFQKSTILQ
jgi:hypothetical protein